MDQLASHRKVRQHRRAVRNVALALACALLFVFVGSSRAEADVPAIPTLGGICLTCVAFNHLTGAKAEDSITETLTKKTEEAVMHIVLDGTAKLVNFVLIKITTASTPVVNGNAQNGDWFAIQYQMMMNVGWWLMLPLLFVTIIHSVMKGSMQLLLRSFGMYLPLAVLGTVVATTIIQLLIQIVDDMCAIFISAVSQDLKNYMKGMVDVLAGNGLGIILGFILGIILTIFSLYLWLVFMLRDGSVYMAVMFMPIGFAMMVWPMAARYFRKMIEFLVGIIVAKLVMVIVISLSIAALAGSTGTITAGMQRMYPDGTTITTDKFTGPGSDGIAGTADDTASDDPKSDIPLIIVRDKAASEATGFLQSIGYVFPAVVMLALAALSPPMTVKLVGNLGLGEMAGQMADTLNTQSWLYQYIGAERQTRIWFKNPKRLYGLHQQAREQKKQLKKTSLQEQMLESMGHYRGKDGTYAPSMKEMKQQGFFDGTSDGDKYGKQIMDMLDPTKNKDDANLIAAGLTAYKLGRDNFAGFEPSTKGQLGFVVKKKDGSSLLVMDIVDRQTKAPLRHMDTHLLRRSIDQEAQRQKNVSGEVKGITVISPVQMAMDGNGQYHGVNKQQKSWQKIIDRTIVDAKNKHGTKRIRVQHKADLTIKDMVDRDFNDGVESEVNHPRQGTKVGVP